MIKNRMIILLILFISSVAYTGCANKNDQNTTENTRRDITVAELKEQMQNNPDLVILDVRTKEELTGELPKIESAINIPLQELENKMDELKIYKDKKIAVICRSGRRSSIATDLLVKNGYIAENVLGGMKAYFKK